MLRDSEKYIGKMFSNTDLKVLIVPLIIEQFLAITVGMSDTVAAGGHRKVVKPVRKGIRHGHEVIVNRQLCIANAFEQILEEKTPRFHKLVRGVYDRYGFPVARLIKSKWIADIIYIMMKPLEWIFLAVIYMSDVHPENRIETQYMGKND